MSMPITAIDSRILTSNERVMSGFFGMLRARFFNESETA